MTDLPQIKKHLDRLRELNSMSFKSDEETQEAEQLIKELATLLTDIGIKDMKELDQLELFDTQKHEENIDKFEQDEVKYLAQAQKKDINIEEKLTEMKLNELTRQKKNLANLINLAKTQQDIDGLKEKLAEINKEANYITSKPDKAGIIHIREEVLARRLAQLEQELETATGWWKRIRLKGKIDSLKSLKRSVQTRNTVIKVARGARKVSETITTIGDELSQIGKFSGYDTKKKNGKEEKPNDFGFNLKSIYGNGKEKREKKSKPKYKWIKGKRYKLASKKKKDKDDDEGDPNMGYNLKNVFGKGGDLI